MTAFEANGTAPTLDWVVNLMVVVAVISAIAVGGNLVRGSATGWRSGRERRLVALRSPGDIRPIALLAAVDAMLISIPGALLRIVVFLALGRSWRASRSGT